MPRGIKIWWFQGCCGCKGDAFSSGRGGEKAGIKFSLHVVRSKSSGNSFPYNVI